MKLRQIAWIPVAGAVAVTAAGVFCDEVPAAAGQPAAQAGRATLGSAADAALEGRVKGALSAALGVPAQQISVRARDGFVLLSGTVRSAAAREGAELAAQRAPGVRSLENGLTIVGGS